MGLLWGCCGAAVRLLWVYLSELLWRCCGTAVGLLWKCCGAAVKPLWGCCEVALAGFCAANVGLL